MTLISHPKAQGMSITRDAHEALAVLKKLVDSAEEKVRLAERETAAVAISHQQGDDPLRTLRDVEDTLKSQRFQAAVSDAREKIETAVKWHLRPQN
jgi:hypothetical protein